MKINKENTMNEIIDGRFYEVVTNLTTHLELDAKRTRELIAAGNVRMVNDVTEKCKAKMVKLREWGTSE